MAGAAAAQGELSGAVPRSAVERFYAPGTDGGAHEQAGLDAERLPLAQVARAAIEVSDNAAADLLLDRVGAARVDDWARQQGMRRQDPIYPLLGEYAAWSRDDQWAQRTPPERAERAIALARQLTGADVEAPDAAAQQSLAAVSVAGTPREWATLMQRIGTRGDPLLRRLLDWPRRQSAQTRKTFDAYLTKGGSFAGVITEVSYIRPRDSEGAAVALFLRDLPLEVMAQMGKSFAQQELVRDLATDPAALTRARERLAG